MLNTLKPGLDEKLYERALAIELRKRGHYVQTQVTDGLLLWVGKKRFCRVKLAT